MHSKGNGELGERGRIVGETLTLADRMIECMAELNAKFPAPDVAEALRQLQEWRARLSGGEG